MSIWLRWTARMRSKELQQKAERRGLGRPTEEVEAEWRDRVFAASITGYQGLAEGELRGRLELANEIEAAFGNGISPTDAERIRQRQVH